MIQNESGKAKISKLSESNETNALCRARRAYSGQFFFLKMDIVCERYRVLNFFPNRQNVKGQSQLFKGRIADIEDDISNTS
jgi:hypothetical protein